MERGLCSSLCSCCVKPLQEQKMPSAANVWEIRDKGVGFVRRFVPVADVRCGFPGSWVDIYHTRTLHARSIDDPEVGAALANSRPGIAVLRAEDNSVRVFEIVHVQVARKAQYGALRIEFWKPLKRGHNLKIYKAGELLRA